MNIIFVLVVMAIYAFTCALTRRPWLPWAGFGCLFLSAAAVLTFWTDLPSREIERASAAQEVRHEAASTIPR